VRLSAYEPTEREAELLEQYARAGFLTETPPSRREMIEHVVRLYVTTQDLIYDLADLREQQQQKQQASPPALSMRARFWQWIANFATRQIDTPPTTTTEETNR
jgi:hypothetical protein